MFPDGLMLVHPIHNLMAMPGLRPSDVAPDLESRTRTRFYICKYILFGLVVTKREVVEGYQLQPETADRRPILYVYSVSADLTYWLALLYLKR